MTTTSKADPGAMREEVRPIRTTQAIAWASGSLPQAIAIYVFGTLVFRHLTDNLALGAALVGALVGASKFYDAAIDPLIGNLTDRVDTPMGRRRPWLLLGGLLMAVSLALVFNIPREMAMGLKLTLVVASLLLFSTGFSLFAIPWMAMPAEVTNDLQRRTYMMSWRVGFSSLGNALASSGGPLLIAALGATAVAYAAVGWVMATVCLVATVASVIAMRSLPPPPPEVGERPSAALNLKLMLENRPFLVLIGLKAMIYIGVAFNSAAIALLTKWAFGLSDRWLASYGLAMTLANVGSQVVWIFLFKRFGKRAALRIALLLQAAAQISLFLNPGVGSLLVVQGALIGAGIGGIFMLSQSLLPDVIEYDYRKTGLRRGGSFAGAMAFLETSSAALATFVMGLILANGGYIPGLGATGSQPAEAVDAIRICASLIPAAAQILTVLLLPLFRLPALEPARK